MSLVIHAGLYRAAVLRHLGQLVPPEHWQMDTFGFISMPNPPTEGVSAPGVLMLWNLVRTPGLVEIAGTEGASSGMVNGVAIQLRDIGGAAYFDPLAQGETAGVTVFYDTTNNYNVGYWTEGEGGVHIDIPPHILLGHELAHAIQAQAGTWFSREAGELYAIEFENTLRAANQPALPLRTSHNGGPNKPPQIEKPPPKKSGCFVATAAYGSELDPAVEELRQFRDNIVRKTRYGAELHDRLLPTYQLASLPIIAAMSGEGEIRDVVRDWVVRPLVHYLRLARDFPDLPVETAGPWAPFVTRMRDDLAEFARVLPLPSQLQAVPPEEAVDELIVALTFQLRTEEARLTWLKSLQQEGELPLVVDNGQRALLACRLAEKGRTPAEIACILGTEKPDLGKGCEGRRQFMATAFGNDTGTPAETISWRYTVTIRNNMPTTSLINLRVYYLAAPGGPTDMGVVMLPDLHYTEVGVFPLCECGRLISWYLETDFVDDIGSGSFVWPDNGVMGPDSMHDGHPCEDSIVLEE